MSFPAKWRHLIFLSALAAPYGCNAPQGVVPVAAPQPSPNRPGGGPPPSTTARPSQQPPPSIPPPPEPLNPSPVAPSSTPAVTPARPGPAGPQGSDSLLSKVLSALGGGGNGGTGGTTPSPPTPNGPSPPPSPAQPLPSGGNQDLPTLCQKTINDYRATLKAGALTLNTGQSSCSDDEAGKDGQAGSAHANFGACQEMAQDECPGWGDGDAAQALTGCLKMMWDEGPGGGHYENMANHSYRSVACGFKMVNGSLWMVQNFY